MGGVRPSLRRHRGPRPSDRPDPRRAIRLSPWHLVDLDRRGAWRLRAGLRHAVFSTRRNARSLGQMARDELGPLGGVAALIGVMMIMIILIAVLGLVVVNAMKHSPWATSTVAATIPIAILIGLYMRHIRPGRVREG